MNTLENKISFFFAGDICIQHAINKDFIANKFETFIKKHDYRIATWEAPNISSDTKKTLKKGPHLHQHETSSFIIKKKIFNIFSLANNHIMDYGIQGLKNTITHLENSHTTGAATAFDEIYKPLIIEKNNIKIAIIAAAETQFGCAKNPDENNHGYAWIFSDIIIKNIIKLKKQTDFIIIMPHAGLEMQNLPLPEWRKLYKTLIDFGADLIVASHPHVIQPKEKYKGKNIYYSLGNFFFNSHINNQNWFKSLTLSCQITKNKAEKNMTIKEIFTKNTNNFIDYDNENQINKFKTLNNIITNKNEYYKQINQICTQLWNNYYKKYYTFNPNKYIINNLPKILKKSLLILKKRIYKNKGDEIMIFHNIAIETHRFVVERALKSIHNIF